LGTEDQVEPTDEVTPPSTEEQAESSEATEVVEPEVEVKPKATGFQKRVQKFQAQLTAKEQELEYWKNVALQGKQVEAPQVSAAKPKLADFDSVEEYVEAREDFLRKELLETVTQQAAQATRQNTVQASYQQKVSEAQKALPDWDEVMELAADEPTSPETVQFCMDSDIGPRIAYHLAKNPEEHERINKLSPMRRVAELGKLEDRLTAPKAAPQVKVTKAPSKLTDVKGTGSSVTKHPGEATSYAEWKKLDEARRAKK
jgi:hypothetical protein